MRATGNRLRNSEPRPMDKNDNKVRNFCPIHHNTSTGVHRVLINLTCIGPLYMERLRWHQDSNPRHAGHELMTLTNRLPRLLHTNGKILSLDRFNACISLFYIVGCCIYLM
ncbi:hypothetical protein TNCV_4770841 [Trichonephila clavipes]|nr:hypothetical protein TNCV_4770841 [Trichonephila clavipes]